MKSIMIQLLVMVLVVALFWPALARAANDLIRYATYGYVGGYPAGTNQGQVPTPYQFGVVEIKLDFAAIAVARAAAGQVALAAADILTVIPVLANTWVQMVSLKVETVEGETATISVGDGTATAGYLATVDANALGHTGSLVTSAFSVAVGGGKLYTVDDTIDMLLNTAAFNVAVVRLKAVLIDMRNYRQ